MPKVIVLLFNHQTCSYVVLTFFRKLYDYVVKLFSKIAELSSDGAFVLVKLYDLTGVL